MKRFHALSPLAMLFAATALAAPAHAAPATGPTRYFTGNDLFNLEVATDPQISPDGRTIAYVRKSNDIMTDKARSTIWLVDAATGQQRPLLAGSGSYFSPRWSPDGSRLAYVAAEGGNPQLYVRWMAGGESARITGLPDSPGAVAWSPDGAANRLHHVRARRRAQARQGAGQARRRQMGRPAPGDRRGHLPHRRRRLSEARLLPDLLGAVGRRRSDPADFRRDARRRARSWTPDSRSILFSADLSKNWEREPLESEIYRVSIDGGAPVALTSRVGPDNAPTVSPDGRHIAFVGFDDRKLGYQNAQLSIMNLDGSDKRVLTGSLDRSVGDPAWSADSRAVYVLVEDRGTNKVERVGLDGSIREVASRPHRRGARPALCRRRVQCREKWRGRGHERATRCTRPTSALLLGMASAG